MDGVHHHDERHGDGHQHDLDVISDVDLGFGFDIFDDLL